MIQENFMYDKKPRRNSKLYIVLLILSFIWLELYPSTLSLVYSFENGYGDIFSGANISSVAMMVLIGAVAGWIGFEFLFWIYRYVLSYKIYSFIVPMDSLKAESRIFFIFRNLILGLFCNLCFLFPYIYTFEPLLNLIVTMVTLIVYSKHLNNTYSDAIVGHFVFKNFCFPIFIYEAIEITCGILVVLL